MAPNSTLIRDYSTFGDLTQRDVYHRHHTQVIKEGSVENFFVHLDEADDATNTVLEKVTLDGVTAESTYELFTKPSSGPLSEAANTSMLEITTSKTVVRSLVFQAAGNVALGNLAVSGASNLNTLSTSGNAGIGGALDVTGETTLTDVSASGNSAVTGTLDVTGATSVSTLDASGAATITGTLGVTGETTLTDLSASGNAAVTGTLDVTGATSVSTLDASGAATITGTLDVTGETTLTDLSASGNAAVTGTLGVTGETTLTDLGASGNAAITGTLDVTGATSVSTLDASGAATITGTLDVTGETTLTDLSASGNAAVTGTLGVTGETTLTDLGASGNAAITGTLDVTGATSVSTLDASGAATITGTLDVTGETTLTDLSASGNAAVTGTLGVTGETTLTDLGASGNAAITGTLDVTGATSVSTLDASGAATITGTLDVTGETTLTDLSASGNAAVTGTLGVTGETSLTDATLSGDLTVSGQTSLANTTIALGDTGNLLVTGSGTVDLGANDLLSSGNVDFTGVTSIQNLVLTGSSGFGADLDMGNNNIINVVTMVHDNVRVLLDNTARTIEAQTFTGVAWESALSIAQEGVSTTKPLSTTSTLAVAGDLSCNGASILFGNVTSQSNMTLFGNLEIKGTATNTRIESNVVQVGDKNVELGYLEIDTLANLDGAGLTIGGPGGLIAVRPELVYSSTYDAWQPNIDIVAKGGASVDIAKMDTDGYFMSSNVATPSIFTKINSTSINFGDKWRFQHDTVNDTMELQHYESGNWVSKFSYTA